ncbi:MAG: hypothetical protein AAF787_06600 [Chloroflexota bacterium]
MTLFDEAVQITEKLSPVEKIKPLEQLSASLRYQMEIEAHRHIPWEQFVDSTYGILADSPIQRGEQPLLDVRDEIE